MSLFISEPKRITTSTTITKRHRYLLAIVVVIVVDVDLHPRTDIDNDYDNDIDNDTRCYVDSLPSETCGATNELDGGTRLRFVRNAGQGLPAAKGAIDLLKSRR